MYVVVPHDPEQEERWSHHDQNNDIFMDQYYKDCRSVFIGNLPNCVNDDLVRLVTSPYGRVVEVQLRQNTIPNGKRFIDVSTPAYLSSRLGKVVHFAFVEFESAQIAETIVARCVRLSPEFTPFFNFPLT